MKFLLLFLISFSVYGNYLALSELESCADNRTVFTRLSDCQFQKGEACFKLPQDYDCNYHRVLTTKNDAESCADDPACQAALSSKQCSDPSEQAIMVLDTDPKEVYCTKTHSAENASLKASHNLQKANRDAAKAARKSNRDATLAKLQADQNLNPAETREVLRYLLGD